MDKNIWQPLDIFETQCYHTTIKKTSEQERKKQEEAKMKKRISMAIAVATAAATMASVSVPDLRENSVIL